jgi:hypothetical protein
VAPRLKGATLSDARATEREDKDSQRSASYERLRDEGATVIRRKRSMISLAELRVHDRVTIPCIIAVQLCLLFLISA